MCVLADLGYTVLSDTCTPAEGPEAPLWLDILAHVSLGITTLFLIEIPITLWAMGLSYFNPLGPLPHASLHLFDATVIVGTFILEIVLRGRERELAGLLIILRLWRLVKLVGGTSVPINITKYDLM
jgi:voltage-gated hydrogen channel 1